MSVLNPVRLGMVGGGQGGFIGSIHRTASRMDGKYVLCAGAFSSDPLKSKESGRELGLDEDRIYETYGELLDGEIKRNDGIEAVSIVTPNNMHFPIARRFLEAGIHVICDKPFTLEVKEADVLIELAREKNLLLAVTYNYSGYPMIKQARAMIKSGDLGKIRVIQAEYAQGWLSEAIEQDGHKQASWRTDPKQSGISGCVGDIGTHAYHLMSYTSGLTPTSLCATLSTFVKGRQLDDDANILLRFEGGATGSIWVSQIAVGQDNGLRLRIFGEKGGVEWSQENPNELVFSPLGGNPERLTGGSSALHSEATTITRLPPGHPEGYIEAFANLYSEIASTITALRDSKHHRIKADHPSGEDGREGVNFIHSVVRSNLTGSTWIDL